MTDPFVNFRQRVLAGTITYEEAADMFVTSLVSPGSNVSREAFLVEVRQRFPTLALLNASLLEVQTLCDEYEE